MVWVMLSVPGAGPEGGTHPAIPSGGQDAPWAHTSQEQQDQGLELFERANEALYKSRMSEAVQLYRQALERWDHPAFHYNLALALMAQSRTLECHQEFEAAIKYGPEPLQQPDKYQNAVSILAAVEGQLARIELTCDQPGVQLSDNGRPLPVACPGSHAEWIQPGLHVIQIAKAPYRTSTRSFDLKPGDRAVYTLRVHPESEWTRTELPKDSWRPWVVLGGGGAVLITGIALHLVAAKQVQDYDAAIIRCIGEAAAQPTFEPCLASEDLKGLPGRANVMQGFAYTADAIGIAAIAAGGAFLYFNTPRSVLEDPEGRPTAVITPQIAPGFSGVAFTLKF
jgi:tetratricopeptide (TPR) repeat protein